MQSAQAVPDFVGFRLTTEVSIILSWPLVAEIQTVAEDHSEFWCLMRVKIVKVIMKRQN